MKLVATLAACIFVGAVVLENENGNICRTLVLGNHNDIGYLLELHPLDFFPLLTKSRAIPENQATHDSKVDQDVLLIEGKTSVKICFSPRQRIGLTCILADKIGSGAVGDVFLGRTNNAFAAVKMAEGPERIESLRKEALRMSVVSGKQGFPVLHAHGTFDSIGILVMEYFPAGDLMAYVVNKLTKEGSGSYFALADLRDENKPFLHPLQRHSSLLAERHANILRIATDAFVNLQTLHRHNILHRDIKPHNIFLKPDGLFIIGDLGDGRTSTPAYYSERLMYGHDASPADDCFAMLLTILIRDGLMIPNMVTERVPPGAEFREKLTWVRYLVRLNIRRRYANWARVWDIDFRRFLLEKAVATDRRYEVWLDIWNLLKSPEFNSWGLKKRTPPSPHARILSLLQDASSALSSSRKVEQKLPRWRRREDLSSV